MQEWLAEWQATRMCSVLTGHAGNRDAAEPARAREEELRAVLARPPSQAGVHAEFWDVPAIRDAVKTLSDAEYRSDSSYRLLPPLCGPNPEPPDPFDEHRNEPATTRRMAWATTQVKALLDQGRKAHTARLRPAPSTRPGPAACSPRKDNAPDRPWTGRRRPSPSPTPSPTSRTVTPHPTEQNQNTWQTTLAPDPLQQETGTGKTAVVPDNARPHHARALTDLHEPDRLLERITPIHPPPYAPDHQPGRSRPEHGQEQHRDHPARDTRRNPRRIRPTHHRPNIRPRLRTPPTPRNQKRFCFMTAI